MENDFKISTEKYKLDISAIHDYLSNRSNTPLFFFGLGGEPKRDVFFGSDHSRHRLIFRGSAKMEKCVFMP